MRLAPSLAIVAAALAVGVLIGGARSETPARAAHTAPAAPPRVVPDVRAPVSVDRAALRAELGAALVAHGARPAAEAPAEPAATETQLRASQSGHALVDAAIDAGAWRAEHRTALGALMQEMSADDQLAVLGRLAAAINRDEIVPDEPALL